MKASEDGSLRYSHSHLEPAVGLPQLVASTVSQLTEHFAYRQQEQTTARLEKMETSIRGCGSQLRKLKMVLQELKAEKDFYK
jgi:hypothetical protein